MPAPALRTAPLRLRRMSILLLLERASRLQSRKSRKRSTSWKGVFSLGVGCWALSVQRFLIKQNLAMSIRYLLITCLFSHSAQITAVSAATSADNPLLTESALPFHYPPFDKIKDVDFAPAMDAG